MEATSKQHVVLGDIGAALVDEALDHRLHLIDMLGGARLDGGIERAERGHVLMELRLGLLGDAPDRLVQRQTGIILRGARVDLVVDVGDVADIGDVLRPVDVTEQPKQHVEHDDGARIADMGEVVDRRPAHIHAHVGGIERLEDLLLAGERVVKLKRHGPSPFGLRPAGRSSANLIWIKEERPGRALFASPE